MADRFQWTPAQVDALDPAFVDELMLFQTARSDHELLSADSTNNPDLKKSQAKRRSEIVKWRHGE